MIPNYFWLKAILPSFIFQLIKFDCQELLLAGRVILGNISPHGELSLNAVLRDGMWNDRVLTPRTT